MEKQTSTRFNWRRFYWQFAIYLVLYVLSIGPMYWRWHVAMHLSNPSLADTLIVQFYQPLLFACEIGFIRDAVNAYINWWIL